MKRWILWIFLGIFSLLFLVSSCILGTYCFTSLRQQQASHTLAQIMHESAAPQETTASIQETAPQPEQTDTPEATEVPGMLPEFTALYAMNPDIVGWITIPGTRIDYPVMQTPEQPDYYLSRGFDKAYSRHGCIYVREECDVAAPSDNLTIYGHRMGDGTMFNDLHKYLDADFCRENPSIFFTTLTQRRTYEILAVFAIASDASSDFPYHLFVDAAEEVDFDAYIAQCNARALYDTGVTASYGDKLITLSTCEYTQENGRLVVVARSIDE